MAIAITSWLTNVEKINRIGEISGRSGTAYTWSNTTNLQTPNDTPAILTTSLSLTGALGGDGYFPFIGGAGISNTNIPDTATIDGLIVSIRRRAINSTVSPPAADYENRVYNPSNPPLNVPGIAVTDSIVQLVYNGSLIGLNKAKTDYTDRWSYDNSFRTDSFGSETDSWGVSGLGLSTWLIKQAGFGLSMSPHITFGTWLSFQNGYAGYTEVDSINLTFFYTPVGDSQIIYPPPILTQEKLGQHKLIRNIHHRSISDRDVLGRPALSRLIKANSIQSSEKISIPSLNRIIQPRSIVSQELLRNNNRLSTAANINPRSIKSEEFISRNIKFFNRFYDKLDDYNVWETQSDTGDFTWDNTYLLENNSNSKSLRRIGSPTRTNKFSTSSYKFLFYTSDTLYFSGYVYLANNPNYGGLGFCIQEDLNSGYYAVIDNRNGSGGSSTHSFRLMKVTRSGGTNTFINLSTYNSSGLISEDLWYRIIIELTSSGNITARLYRYNGSTLVNAATLTATDTSFTQGFYGLTAFSEAGFENLTNITAQFSNIDQSIFSQEKINIPQINVGPTIINLNNRSIQSQEKLVSPRTKIYINQIPLSKEFTSSTHSVIPGTAIISSNSIRSSEILTTQNSMSYIGLIYNMSAHFTGNINSQQLNSGGVNILPNTMFKSQYFNQNNIITNISPSSILDTSFLSSNKLISNISVRQLLDISILGRTAISSSIKPLIIFSQENINLPNIIRNIQTYALRKLDSFVGKNNLTTIAYIAQNSFYDVSNLSINSLFNLEYSIKPYGIQSYEKSLEHKISRAISPSSIFSKELIQNHSLNSIISVINLFKNPHTLGNHRILSSNYITPFGFDSNEKLSNHQLSYITYTIRPIGIEAFEKTDIHSLVSNIYPRSLSDFSSSYLKIEQVKASNIIIPNILKQIETLGDPSLSAGVTFIYPYSIDPTHKMGQLVTLTTDQIIFLNSIYDLLPGYQPPITEGPIGIHNLEAINIIAPDSIYSEEQLLIHTLYAIAYIYPFTIVDPDLISNSTVKYFEPVTLQPDPFPGTINGWYVLPYTIESHLNFRKTS